MTATYSPVATVLDEVRLEIGDTDITDAMLQDEEIEHYLTLESNAVLAASARAAAAIAGKFARLTSTQEGDVKVEAQQMYEHYREMAASLSDRVLTESGTAVPYAGGLTIADVEARNDNTDLVEPYFAREPWPRDTSDRLCR